MVKLEQSLLTEEVEGHDQIQQKPLISDNPKAPNLLKMVFIALCIGGIVLLIFLVIFSTKDLTTYPSKISMLIPNELEIEINTGRVIEILFYSGKDDRNQDDFRVVQDKSIIWNLDPEGIVSIDQYGRVEAKSIGKVKVTVTSSKRLGIYDEKNIHVVPTNQNYQQSQAKKINFQGDPAELYDNYQKIVDRFLKSEVQQQPDIPQFIKKLSREGQGIVKTEIIQGQVKWQVKHYADNISNDYILRTNMNLTDSDRDKLQYFIGNRYLPSTGRTILSLDDDEKNGIWMVGSNGDVNHLKMVKMSYREKALLMNSQTEKYVLRHGVASSAHYQPDADKWIPNIQDNDGLWTSLYGVGQLIKYATLKNQKAQNSSIQQARKSALTSLKAVLLIANSNGRNVIVNARIRRLNNTRLGEGAVLSKQYLKKDKPFEIYNYPGSDGVGFYGPQAGKKTDGVTLGGIQKYSYYPMHPEDWISEGQGATIRRQLKGFIGRTFVLAPVDQNPTSGLFFKRNANGSQTVTSGANLLYDYSSSDHPVLNLGNEPLPDILKQILNVKGVQYGAEDLMYKGDTSTDELVGHLFIYTVAFDILDESDSDEKALKLLIRSTMEGVCQHFVENGYNMVDATGIGTKWSKLTRDFFNSDYTLEDAPLKALHLLMSFKLCHHVTGLEKWNKEYTFLIENQGYKYLDLVAKLRSRWEWWAFNEDYHPQKSMFRLNASLNISDVEKQRHIMYQQHYSDDQEAYLAYYMAFQLQKNETLLAKYREGLQGYWHAIRYSENPLWYYIYQLAYPNKTITDGFGNNILRTASWQLNRGPIDMREYEAFVLGSRPDITYEGILTVDPNVVLEVRKSPTDTAYVESCRTNSSKLIFPTFHSNNIYQIKILPQDQRSIHKFNGPTLQNIQASNLNGMQSSTGFTLPYWLGVYHNMLKFN